MAEKSPPENRLPRTFHRSFKPERHYISAMLRYAAGGYAGTYEEIRDATGIPTGAGSGKVQAVLDYCRGMGLVTLRGGTRSAAKRPELTAFGRVVLLEDPYLKEPLTLWLAHFNLCSPLTGADAWYRTFIVGMQVLGMSFSRVELEKHLALAYGTERAGQIGPLIGMYEDHASFGLCGALHEDDSKKVTRQLAPIENEFGYGYGAWMLQLMSIHFPNTSQVTVRELNARAGCRTIAGWDVAGFRRVLQLVERRGLIGIDRHMDPWILRGWQTPADSWAKIYDDLI